MEIINDNQIQFTEDYIEQLKKSINPGNQYHNYKFIKQIGEGQYSKVYLGKVNLKKQNDIYEEVDVAIKLLPIEFKKQPQLYSLFRQEVNILNKLNSPYIIKIIDSFEDERYMGIVTEFCEEGNLWDLLISKDQRYFSEDEALTYFLQIYKGLQQIHQLNMVHRDLKLENILLHNGQAKIADFGFAKELSKITNTVLGSPITMAPEILEEKDYVKYGYKIDVYSLGIILYQLLQGKAPFMAKTTQLLAELIRNSTQSPKNTIDYPVNQNPVSNETKDLVYQMVRYDPDQRIEWQKIIEHPSIKNKMINDQKLKPIIGFADLHKIELNQDQVFLEKELKQEKNYSRMKFKQVEALQYGQSVVNKDFNNFANKNVVNDEQIQTETLKKGRGKEIKDAVQNRLKQLISYYNSINVITNTLLAIQKGCTDDMSNASIVQFFLTKKILESNQNFLDGLQHIQLGNDQQQQQDFNNKNNLFIFKYKTDLEIVEEYLGLIKQVQDQISILTFQVGFIDGQFTNAIEGDDIEDDIKQITQVKITEKKFTDIYKSELVKLHKFLYVKYVEENANFYEFLKKTKILIATLLLIDAIFQEEIFIDTNQPYDYTKYKEKMDILDVMNEQDLLKEIQQQRNIYQNRI